MKLLRNCNKFICIACFFGVVCGFYFCIFQYIEHGKITLHETVARYVKGGGGQIRDRTELENVEEYTEEIRLSSNISEKDAVVLDNWDIVDQYDQLSLDDNHRSSSSESVLKTTSQRVMKLFDFNHRKCCPLNYKFSKCQYSACEFTNNTDEADLVMINAARLKTSPLPRRHPGQLWMMYTKEPPTFHRFSFIGRKDFENQINWTRCIFRDSTFRGHYGMLESRTPPPDKDYDKVYAQKKYQVAWFVSNCDSQSKRGEYVKRMGSEVDVHIYGRCGNYTCGRHGLRLDLYGSKDICLGQVSMDYKYYLSFENSLCSDYVTEKFYKLFENVDVIPVVRGGADYRELAPTGTYVNAKDFTSPEELGKYLFKLSDNKKEYLRMLKLKDRYINTFPKPPYPCELCKALHTRREVPSTYGNMLTWMTDHCWEPDDL